MTHTELVLFGERIRHARNSASLTQEQVAERVGISLRFYQMLECGAKRPSLETLMRLSRTFRISIDYLLLGDAPYSLSNPITEIYRQLSPQQRDDATHILRMYCNACQSSPVK